MQIEIADKKLRDTVALLAPASYAAFNSLHG